MRTLALFFLLPGLALAQDFGPYQATVDKVIDGDTLKLTVALWPGLNQSISLRLDGIDTPEKRGSPDCEKVLAKKATEFTREFVRAGKVVVSDVSLGKYAGRALGSVAVDGKDLVKALIQAGHGRAYDGGKRGSWCQ